MHAEQMIISRKQLRKFVQINTIQLVTISCVSAQILTTVAIHVIQNSRRNRKLQLNVKQVYLSKFIFQKKRFHGKWCIYGRWSYLVLLWVQDEDRIEREKETVDALLSLVAWPRAASLDLKPNRWSSLRKGKKRRKKPQTTNCNKGGKSRRRPGQGEMSSTESGGLDSDSCSTANRTFEPLVRSSPVRTDDSPPLFASASSSSSLQQQFSTLNVISNNNCTMNNNNNNNSMSSCCTTAVSTISSGCGVAGGGSSSLRYCSVGVTAAGSGCLEMSLGGSVSCNGTVGVMTLKTTANAAVLSSHLTRCPLCSEPYDQPKVLACFHTFCRACLEKLVDTPGKVLCPQCNLETQFSADQGVDSLFSDYALINLLEQLKVRAGSCTEVSSSTVVSDAASPSSSASPSASSTSVLQTNCTGCKSKDMSALAHCYDCTNYLCANCVMAHKYMHCFEGHRVVDLCDVIPSEVERVVRCMQHRSEPLKYFCVSCSVPICSECLNSDHPRGMHHFELMSEVSGQQIKVMQQLLDEARNKQMKLMESLKATEDATQRLLLSYQKAQQDIIETANLLQQVVEEQRQQAMRDLEQAYNCKQLGVNVVDKKLQHTMEKLSHTIEFTSRLLQYTNSTETLVFKKLLENRIGVVLNYSPDMNALSHSDLEFVPNVQGSRLAIMNTFGYVRQGQDLSYMGKSGLAPISRPTLSVTAAQYCQPNGSAPGGPGLGLSIAAAHYLPVVNGSGGAVAGSAGSGAQVTGVSSHLAGGSLLNGSTGPVAVNRATGDIIVTERSPTHQIQVYNQYGQFIRKFGANILQHPRGVTVDYKGRIVVVECKVMRVIIFDMVGNVLVKFGCSKYLEFPNGVVTNDRQEIFVSDNRAHSVKVFNYEGAYLRQIGGEGLTNYPIGVGINQLGEVVVADNHNNFNLTVFQQDGMLINALESKVKHAQCFDVALLDDGSVVLASKDYRLYIYRYLQVSSLIISSSSSNTPIQFFAV
ncbi:Brain tumor protein [Trichinella murrelli]|uniref:Brain tumor protein n=1 Tax=Trichinella murrelli TaxID=144512 RepID=A0A0V0TM98_9BILA|nr:Brain tumor protein [Trichinella murrelli]